MCDVMYFLESCTTVWDVTESISNDGNESYGSDEIAYEDMLHFIIASYLLTRSGSTSQLVLPRYTFRAAW